MAKSNNKPLILTRSMFYAMSSVHSESLPILTRQMSHPYCKIY